jgi:hypothetical protein
MQGTGRTPDAGTPWQSLEVDPADASEQIRDLVETEADPEAPATGPRAGELDLSEASEADLVEQLHEVPFDDDGDR